MRIPKSLLTFSYQSYFHYGKIKTPTVSRVSGFFLVSRQVFFW